MVRKKQSRQKNIMERREFLNLSTAAIGALMSGSFSSLFYPGFPR
jgi:hypothetical protein